MLQRLQNCSKSTHASKISLNCVLSYLYNFWAIPNMKLKDSVYRHNTYRKMSETWQFFIITGQSQEMRDYLFNWHFLALGCFTFCQKSLHGCQICLFFFFLDMQGNSYLTFMISSRCETKLCEGKTCFCTVNVTSDEITLLFYNPYKSHFHHSAY